MESRYKTATGTSASSWSLGATISSLGVRSTGGAAVVDRDDRAGDEAGGVGQQVGDRVSDLPAAPDATQRVRRRDLLLRPSRLLRVLLGQVLVVPVVPLGADQLTD